METLDETMFIFIALYQELEGMTANKMQRRVEAPYLRPAERDHGSLRFFYIQHQTWLLPKTQ